MITAAQKAKTGDPQNLAGALAQLYKAVLEMICTEASLAEILECLCQLIEQQLPGLHCSVLLLDPDGATLRNGAAPSLPKEYNRCADGIRIGPNAGSCGTAAYRGERVIVTDIANDPLWKDVSQIALRHGLRACWSTPIFSRAGKVLGTFAVYYPEPRAPEPDHLQMVECATHLAGIAIEREHAEEELRAAETRYRALVERLPAITYIAEVGVLGHWQYVSPQIQSILGFAPEEWLADSANWVNHIHPEDRDRALTAETRFWEAAGAFHAEYRMIARDGRVLWFRDDAVYLRRADAEKPLTQGVLYDITEHKLLEDQLRQSQKMEAIGQLAGGVAHDFNNLLMIIQGRNERILDHLASSNPVHGDAVEVREAVNRAASLTHQLLAFSRKQVLQPRVIDLNVVVGDAGKMLHRLIGENIEVTLRTAPSLWYVKVDQGQMEQTILNLALNSRDAMPHGGKLTIETRNSELDAASAAEQGSIKPGRYAVLEVSDTGVGMDAETQSHIFEPFFSTKEPGKGTGLGLASVYGVVKQSGGWISFASQLGHGTAFRIYLPEACAQPETVSETTAVVADATGTETILVVEDEDQIRDMVSEYLQHSGYNVLHAQNGREALEIAQRYKGLIHLLISDIVMPELGGEALAQQLKRLRPRTKVLFTSGYPEHAHIDENTAGQHPPILQKPFPLNALAGKIREVLDAAELVDLQNPAEAQSKTRPQDQQ
jgi:PAS domain S-box-containing protein